MIVVDSSVWIASFRGLRLPCVDALSAIQDLDAVLVGDLVLLELLQGARSDADAKRIRHGLTQFRVVEMLNAELAVSAAENYRKMRSRGITVRKTPDLIVATYCMERDHHLLHHDRDFAPFAEHLGLKLYG